MIKQSDIDEFLDKHILSVQKPIRYLGGEYGSANKPFYSSLEEGLNTALVFPDTYEVGMSHLGLKILYALLNNREGMMCDRAFAPYPDMKALMEEQSIPLFGVESRKPLRGFDVVGFSLQYELSFPTLLQMLKLSGISVKGRKRGEDEPFIVAGGPVASNPEPLADYMDLVFIGDAEESFPEALDLIRAGRREKLNRQAIISRVAESVPGVYAPSLYEPLDEKENSPLIPVQKNIPRQVERRVVDLDRFRVPSAIPVPHGEIIHNRASLEIMRGCSRGCRFCHAGFFYRPKRERRLADLCQGGIALLENTGFSEISLSSLSTSDYSEILPLARQLSRYTQPRKIGTELPSSRLDSLDIQLLKEISSVKRGGLTLAPEAGTQRLRDVINKNITEDDIQKALSLARSLGWKAVKLYFMIGLPTETDEDLDGITALVNRLAKERWAVRVSLSVFIPKPHTPFQWEKPLQGEELSRRYSYVYTRLDKRVKMSWRSPLTARLEALFSRGGRHLSVLLDQALEAGIYLDGWDEYFQKEKWKTLLNENPRLDDELKELCEDAFLPWDIIHIGVDKSFLIEERKKAYAEQTTSPCIPGCRKCGVCGEGIEVIESRGDGNESPALRDYPVGRAGERRKYRFWFSRTGVMRFLSQKDLIHVIQSSLMRSNSPILFSEGFNPHPRISFCQPAPLGIETEHDFFECSMTAPLLISPRAISRFFPEGMDINAIEEITDGSKSSQFVFETAAFPVTESRKSRFEKDSWVYFDKKKEKYVTIKGVVKKENREGQLVVTYDNREASLKKLIQYLLDGEEEPRQLSNIRRTGFHKGE